MKVQGTASHIHMYAWHREMQAFKFALTLTHSQNTLMRQQQATSVRAFVSVDASPIRILKFSHLPYGTHIQIHIYVLRFLGNSLLFGKAIFWLIIILLNFRRIDANLRPNWLWAYHNRGTPFSVKKGIEFPRKSHQTLISIENKWMEWNE